jgi:hypothetical protein
MLYFGRAACEAFSTMWNLFVFSPFALGPRKPTKRTWWSWPVVGSSGCKLTSSQQSGIKYSSPNISPYLCCSFIEKKCLFLQILLCACNLDKHQTVYNTCGSNIRKYATNVHICICDSFVFGKFESLLCFGKIGCYKRTVTHPVTKIMFDSSVPQISFPPYLEKWLVWLLPDWTSTLVIMSITQPLCSPISMHDERPLLRSPQSICNRSSKLTPICLTLPIASVPSTTGHHCQILSQSYLMTDSQRSGVSPQSGPLTIFFLFEIFLRHLRVIILCLPPWREDVPLI